MTRSSLLEQAREGDAAAIAALLQSSLKSQGIVVRGERESYCLRLWLTASPAPAQPTTVAYVRRAIERLQVPTLGVLQIYGEQTGFTQPAWSEEIALLSLVVDLAPAVDAFSSPLPEPVSLKTVSRTPESPAIEPAPELLWSAADLGADPSPAVVRAYGELGLSQGASLPEVESVYFKRRAELLRRGDRATLEPLKWAFATLKTHLEQAVTEAADDSFTEQAASAMPVPSARRSPPRPTPFPASPAAPDHSDILSFNNPYSNGLVFPVLLLLGMVMNALPIVNALLWGIKIWIHEFGHATVAWLAGRRAIPLPLGWTNFDPRRSLFVYLGILVLLGLLYWAGRREGKHWPMGLASVLALVQFTMTWLISADTFNMLFSFGGIGGEIYLSALLMVSFYFPLPNYFRWDYYRFPVVVGAAFCFWGQLWLWQQIARGQASIPFGSLWGEADHGDMNQLIHTYGWTPGDIIGTYSTLAHLCLLAIIVVYGYTLFRQHRAFFTALGRQWLP
jgi:hypothetical protein